MQEKSEEVNENSTLYIPLASKADIFRLTQQLYKVNEFEDIKESHLVNSCIRFKKDATGHVLTMLAYNEKTFVKYLNPIISEPKTFYFPSPAPLSKIIFFFYSFVTIYYVIKCLQVMVGVFSSHFRTTNLSLF
jgi:hypothetical protein